MNSHREAVAAMFEALRIDSATGFSWFGESTPPLPAEVAGAMDPETARTYLCTQLQGQLYANFYCAGRPVPRQRQLSWQQPHGSSPFLESLSRANSGSGSRESGWTIIGEEEDGRLVVERDGFSLWARPEELRGSDLTLGSAVSVTLPPELLRLSPGFYMALGNEELAGAEPIVRLYLHLDSSGGEVLVAAATRALNGSGLPFRLKVLSDPTGYRRCDAGVLYAPRRLWAEVTALLPGLLAELAGHLRPGAPALTKPLAEGVGVAEGPADGDSFGMQRCGLLAAAAVRAYELGLNATAARLEVVEQQFDAEGLELDRPYLNPGSRDEFELAA
jgi:hypothetical protein